MTFGLPFLIFFHVFFEILKNVKYISRLMYFVVLSLQKMIKKRYIFIKNFILFHDSLFYRFFIDFGGARGLRKWSRGARDAPSKIKVPTVKLTPAAPGGPRGDNTGRHPKRFWPFWTDLEFRNVPGHHFGRPGPPGPPFWMNFG